jgi:hypothetical protein
VLTQGCHCVSIANKNVFLKKHVCNKKFFFMFRSMLKKKEMIGAIVFILSLLVLGFCVISPSATQKFQATAINAWDKMGINRGFQNLMNGLEDSPLNTEVPQGFNLETPNTFPSNGSFLETE